MFMMEGIPAIALGAAVYWTLAETPHEAKWLDSGERDWLIETLGRERQAEDSVPQSNFLAVLFSGRIWLLSIVYFGVSTTMYGLGLWLPTVIQSFSGLGNFATSLITVLPYMVTVIAMVLVGLRSDRVGERRWHTAIPAFTAAAGMVMAAYGRFNSRGCNRSGNRSGLCRVNVWPVLGDGDLADDRPLRRRRDRYD